jgi:hypothetical protein
MYTNDSNIPLPYAVWLAADHGYDLKFNPDVYSATEILRPMRSIILSREIKAQAVDVETRDVADKAASSLGTAVHTAVEVAWKQHYVLAMTNLGYPESTINRIQINPDNPQPEDINMYFERRAQKEIDGSILSGKFDLVMDAQVRDIKTTKVYTYMKGSQDEKYMLQGSIYRWLNQDIIQNDHMIVDYYFTDWNPVYAASKKEQAKNYPPNRMLEKKFELLSLADTETMIVNTIGEIKAYTGKPQADLPLCTPKELWQNPSKWEFWSKATNKQCSKLFDTQGEAMQMFNEKGGGGMVRERKFRPTFCLYCDARAVCQQAASMDAQGLFD